MLKQDSNATEPHGAEPLPRADDVISAFARFNLVDSVSGMVHLLSLRSRLAVFCRENTKPTDEEIMAWFDTRYQRLGEGLQSRWGGLNFRHGKKR